MEDKKCCCSRLSVCNLAFSLGIVIGLGAFLATLFAMMLNTGGLLIQTMQSVFVNYEPTFIGAVWGLVYGFVWGFVHGGFIAFFYNLCGRCCPCKNCKADKCCK